MRIAPILACATLVCAASIDDATRQLSREIFKELIEINTTDSIGDNTRAAEAMAKRLKDAGFPDADIHVLAPVARKGNVIVRLHGTSAKKPVLIIGHLDVVEARREDWTTNPFEFVEKDGYFYGRGTQDMKVNDAILVTTFIRFKRENYRPDRDLILALTSDEEGGSANGVEWLLKAHRDLIDAEFVLNADAGGVTTAHGKPVNVDVEASEKQYADFELTSLNPGGHSSLPTPDNAIYHLTDALSRLEHAPFPVELNSVTRTYFERRAPLESAPLRADMNAVLHNPPDAAAVERLSHDARYNSTLRTTCVATRLNAGHANNALPQSAKANVNCRILPGHTPEETRETLIRVFDDPKVAVRFVDSKGAIHDRAPDSKGFPTMLPSPDVLRPLEKVAAEMWPEAPVIPDMETGASDSIYTMAAGIPSYGVNGIAIDQDDIRAHGKDERVRVGSYFEGVDFYYRFLKAMTSGQ
jgi:acetylornithine deacetylase/succinyl-diaminopimelate desuccinylase-like protein